MSRGWCSPPSSRACREYNLGRDINQTELKMPKLIASMRAASRNDGGHWGSDTIWQVSNIAIQGSSKACFQESEVYVNSAPLVEFGSKREGHSWKCGIHRIFGSDLLKIHVQYPAKR